LLADDEPMLGDLLAELLETNGYSVIKVSSGKEVLTASARDRLTLAAYELLGYISFFTVGADEVRAWTIRRGDTAVDAAAAIHSDLARGFIRAECFTYDDIMAHSSEKALKDKGLIRLEGKTYPVKDGDILSIRFSV